MTTVSFAATFGIAYAQSVFLPAVGSVDISIPRELVLLVKSTVVPLQVPSQPEVLPALQIESLSPALLTHGRQALSAAASKLGAPYVWGAAGPDSFDCSGLVQWAYLQAGVSIPRTMYDQEVGGTPVSRQDLEPGDPVLFYGGEHVGLCAGDGEVVHAPTSGQSVKRAPLDSMPFYVARRY